MLHSLELLGAHPLSLAVIDIREPADWRAVAVVHQEPQLFPNLTVAQNVLVGQDTDSRPPLLSIGVDRLHVLPS